MNLTWHIARKDILHLRVLLIPWLATVAIQVIVCGCLLFPPGLDLRFVERTGMLFNLVAGVGYVLTFFLTAALVLEDPLSGDNTFWVTRPISGQRLLGAKLLAAILVLGLPPVLLWLPWWFYCGFHPSDLLTAAGRTVVWQLLAMFPAFVLASQSGRAARFTLVTVALAVATWVALVVAYAYDFPSGIAPTLLTSRLLLALGVLFLAGCASVWRRYGWRSGGGSQVILGVGLAIAFTCVAASPWNLVEAHRAWQWSDASNQGVSMRISAVHDAMQSDSRYPADFILNVSLDVSGLPDDLNAGAGWADVELRWPDGVTLTRRDLPLLSEPDFFPTRRALGLPPPSAFHSWDAETEAWLTEQAVRRVGAEREQRYRRAALDPTRHDRIRLTLRVSRTDLERWHAVAPTCRVAVRGELEKPVRVVELPFRSNTMAQAGGVRARLGGIVKSQAQPLRLPHSEPIDVFDGTLSVASCPGTGDLQCFLLFREYGSGWRWESPRMSFAVPLSSNLGTFYLSQRMPQVIRGGAWVNPSTSPQESNVAIVRREFVKRFSCSAETAALPITPYGDPANSN
ncbi:MAG TPA: hypothetical protein VHD32_10330 [Candidatus Didemnitutus sp.]|nr:hypothetical protein [Candidatus Didemnitutus sp.]